MPLPIEACMKLAEVEASAGEFQLFGLFINPNTGEMGTYSSSGAMPGQVLGFLKRGTQAMLEAAQDGELTLVGEEAEGTATESEDTSARKPYIVQ